MSKGLLLLNLGSPNAPERSAVARYLRQFLSDPRVIDIPAIPRALLVNGIIAPFRSGKSARAYRSVWTDRGSPLLSHSRDLSESVQSLLGTGWKVALGMRYGNPSTESALQELVQAGCDRIAVLPLYPQYSSATTGSSLEEVWRVAGKLWNTPYLSVVPPFHNHEGYLAATAAPIRSILEKAPEAHVLFSFHGLPERQVRKGSDACLKESCCDLVKPHCYKSQCHATARALAHSLDLSPECWHISFQSRLGRDPWIGPSTENMTKELASKGVTSLVVAAPSFVADCLETLEELNDRLRATFMAAGGSSFHVAPCPNSDPAWAQAVADLARISLG
jgi:protoporphyrin/coproporphyrin ferrochelatase